MIPAHRRHGSGRPPGHPSWQRSESELRRLIAGDAADETPHLAAPERNPMPRRYEDPDARAERLQREYADERAERRIDLVSAMTAHLRGEELTGRDAIYAGCRLSDFEVLANVSLPFQVRLGGTSSSEWAQILRDTFENRLLDYYRAGQPAYRALTRRMPLKSYRRSTLIRVGEYPQLKQVGEGGEVETGTILDGGEDIQLLRFARIFAVTSTVFTNDDAGALNTVAQQGAEAALFAENALFFATLLSNAGAGPTLKDGTAFFDASRGNLLSGAALGTTSLGLALAALRKQSAPGGAKLNLAGRLLLCGADNEGLARSTVASMSAGTTPLLEVLVDAALGAEWYVFASPDARPAFVYGFLSSNERPFVESRIGWEHDGPEWKVSHSFGVAPFDPRGVVRNPGP